MDTVNGMCSDAPRAKKCKCGKSPTIFDMENGCQIYCANHAAVAAANYRSAVTEWNNLKSVREGSHEKTNLWHISKTLFTRYSKFFQTQPNQS